MPALRIVPAPARSTSAPRKARLNGPWVRLAVNLALVLAWLALFRAVFPYLGVIFTAQEFRANQIILAGAAGLIGLQIRQEGFSLRLAEWPQRYRPALVLALGGAALYLPADRYLDINTLSATLFGLSIYGLLGLWLAPHRWRSGLPAALLLVGALPFGAHMQTFVGYPMRVVTAAIVRDGLAAAGVPAVGVDTILVFESGLAQIDLPCSGVKSLWTGGLFLVAATWIERRRLGLRWLLVALGLAVLLFSANLVRVGVLVLVGQVMGWRLLADMLHVPLGVLGFVGACAAALGLLRRGVPGISNPPPSEGTPPAPRPAWLAPALLVVALGMALAYTPRPPEKAAPPGTGLAFPPAVRAEPWPLTPAQEDWLAREGALTAERWRFAWQGQNGSLLMVTSTSWRAHHRPERCFAVYGLEVEEARTWMVGPGFPVRQVKLGGSGQAELVTAAYWFQSESQITDDYATRIWSDLSFKRQPWVLVTIVFDHPLDPGKGDPRELFGALRETVQRGL